jgi:hypothetical protein
MAIIDQPTTRVEVRTYVLEDLVARLEAAAVPMEGGPLDGIAVVSMGTLRQEVAAVYDEDLPSPSEHRAEVQTPAIIVVSAVCPECRLPSEIVVGLSPTLTVDNDGAELAVKAKSKARVHVCGQMPLPVGDQQSFDLEDVVGEVPSDEMLGDALSLVLSAEELALWGPLAPWSDIDKREAYEWALATHLADSDNDDVVVPPLPLVLGGEDPDPDPDPVVELCPFPDCTLTAEHPGDHQFEDPQPPTRTPGDA